MLDCALWGVSDPATLRWLDPPTASAVDEARRRLIALEALDDDGRITAHGKALAKLPLSPRIAHMLVRGGDMELVDIAADVAVLLGERGIGGQDAGRGSTIWNQDTSSLHSLNTVERPRERALKWWFI